MHVTEGTPPHGVNGVTDNFMGVFTHGNAFGANIDQYKNSLQFLHVLPIPNGPNHLVRIKAPGNVIRYSDIYQDFIKEKLILN